MKLCTFLFLGSVLLSFAFLFMPAADCQTALEEEQGIDLEQEVTQYHFKADPKVINNLRKSRGMLLIPDSTSDTVGLFDPYDGTYLGDVITGHSGFSTPINAVVGPDNNIWVSDQVADSVFIFDMAGNYLSTYADATDGLNNIRGIDFRGGHCFVTSGDDYVAEFDGPHSRLPDFIADGSDPFDIMFLPDDTSLLCDIQGSLDNIRLYDAGGVLMYELFSTSFPEQVITDDLTPGEYLTNSFSDKNIYDFDIAGTIYETTPTPSSGRGVYRLGNGNLLATDGSGVHEFEPGTGTLIETKATGSYRFIELADNFVVEPSIDIKCNGGDGGVIVPEGNNAVVTVDVNEGDFGGYPVELWVMAINKGTGDMYTFGPYGGGGWLPGLCNVYYDGGLITISDTVFDALLPNGQYEAYAAIEMYPNGQINLPFIYKYDVVDFEVMTITGIDEDFDDGVADGFVYDPATYWVQSGVLYGDPNVYDKFIAYFGAMDYADFTLSCDMEQVITADPNETYDYGLVFRGDGTIMNGYEVYVESDGTVYLKQHSNSSSGTTLDYVTLSTNFNVGAGQWNNVKVVCLGPSIEVYINDVLELSATDSTWTTGKVGMMVQGTTIYEQEYEFDNFLLTL